MIPKPYLLFDAGGTIVFPDFQYLAGLANLLGISVTREQLFTIHCDLIYKLDQETRQRKHLIDPFPNGYPDALFEGLFEDPKQRDQFSTAVRKRDKVKAIWTSTYPWVVDSLHALKSAGFSMSVVSNSDGRASQILATLNLEEFFDHIFDSHIIGFNKPDTRLFTHALEVLDIQAQDAVYIGDVYYIDVWGSNQAEMGCIHLDPKGLYRDWPGVHIPTVASMPGLLSDVSQNPTHYDLFPTRGISISF